MDTGEIIDYVKLLGFTILLRPPCVPNINPLFWLLINELLAINDFLTFLTSSKNIYLYSTDVNAVLSIS
jgi:hypothetical protein